MPSRSGGLLAGDVTQATWRPRIAPWPVYLLYLSSSCCRLTMLFVDHTHQLCDSQIAPWPVYLLYLSSSCCRLTMVIVDHNHQLCVGFGGKQRIWTSCGYAIQVRWVTGRRRDPGHLASANCPLAHLLAVPVFILLPPDHTHCRPQPSAVRWIWRKQRI
jgi:hypothetical protein